MASTFIGDVCVSTGEYTASDGQTKKRWTKIGAAFRGDRGISIKLEALPMAARCDPYPCAWLSVFPPRDRDQPQPRPAQRAPATGADTPDAPAELPIGETDHMPF